MKNVFKSISIALFTLMSPLLFCMQCNSMKYTDGRFITNTKVHECMRNIVEQEKRYKEIPQSHEICYDHIGFSFVVEKQSREVINVEIFVPVIDSETLKEVQTFYVNVRPKTSLSDFELVNLLLNSNDFNEQDFDFEVLPSTTTLGGRLVLVNKHYCMYSIALDVTEENWREKFLDSDGYYTSGASSLLFFEIRPDEKVFVEGYEYSESPTS